MVAARRGIADMLTVLVVDDEPAIRLTVGDLLTDAGCDVETAVDLATARMSLAARRRDVVVTDIRLPDGSGHTLLAEVKQTTPDTEVLLVTGYGEVNDAVMALKNGAYDYLTKPFSPDELVLRLDRLKERLELKRELALAKRALGEGANGVVIIGSSPPMRKLLDRIDVVADSDATVLVMGETGTGKELVAQRLHAQSPRRLAPMIPINCTAFPDTLIEAELFGFERGAFTGATKRRAGRFQAAHGGTLFLDEVAEIPLPVQAKLLRVLQDGVVTPLGSDRSVKVDVRIVAATHRDLKALVREGLFREDLYYRLNVLDLVVPPLRTRKSDLNALASAFVARFARDGRSLSISPSAWGVLTAHDYPGNVRELAHAIEHACVLCRGDEIGLNHLPRDMVADLVEADATQGEHQKTLAEAMAQYERQFLRGILRLYAGRRQEAADALGISRKNLWEKLRNHQLSDEDFA
jgi:two-component system, NtrC family, response regulator AtoC